MLTTITLIASMAITTEPPVRWFPPRGDSRCWNDYQACIMEAGRDSAEGRLSPKQLAERLFGCRQRLGWCALVEYLQPMLGDDAAAVVDAIGVEDAAELVEFFEAK